MKYFFCICLLVFAQFLECGPASSAGSGYPEFNFSFEKPFFIEDQKFSAGKYTAIVMPPSLFHKNYSLHIVHNSPISTLQIDPPTIAIVPLLCTQKKVPYTRRYESKITLDGGNFIIFLQFPYHKDEILLISCITLLEASI